MSFPRMIKIKQAIASTAVSDVGSEARRKVGQLALGDKVKAGQAIAITAGSRGIANIDIITKAVVDACKDIGLVPFIVPAMGSHGGATAEGQLQILEHYGITEKTMGCPLKSSMETVRIGMLDEIPVFCDRHAWEADFIAVAGRIKAHTDFEGEIESGLFKMMAIGLGKQEGAEHYHRAGMKYGYARVFPAVGRKVLETARILFGLAIVENAYQQTAVIEAVEPPDFWETEKRLLAQAKSMAAHLPFDNLDLLIVDEIGKQISGTGMDPAVIGRQMVQRTPAKPIIRWIVVRDLCTDSDGNALGIGMADFTTQRLTGKIDYARMTVNAITSANPGAARVPMALANDTEAIRTALEMMGLTPPEKARVVRIKNTLHLTEMEASESLLDEVNANSHLRRISGVLPMAFDDAGNLLPLP